MKAEMYDMEGKKVKSVDLPIQFEEHYEPFLVKRAVITYNQNNRKRYGALFGAGLMGVSAKLSRRRRDYKGSYGHGIARVPRKTLWRRGTQFGWAGAEAPGTTGGRRAHPPKAEKDHSKKINNKERRKAIRSALSGIVGLEKMKIVDTQFEGMAKTKEIKNFISKIGFGTEIEKAEKRKIRAGKGKSRGRKYQTKKGPLVVVADKCQVQKAARNIPGVNVVQVKYLNINSLTKGLNLRESLWTEQAVKKLVEEKLFQ